ncbi:hypothetical protein ACI2KT_05145 [Ensifer adhaerens]|jgi:hypothetical protein|uniref:Uncharacterized protein n=1 Tax=Ensifer adhaerens TaxID=106592 RepID=A0A9Q9D9K7_ENSAD|nr:MULTISPECIES: hypothetical protein [Ensifer]KSV66449.1 hypothetical protein N185_07280 [Sinorhizobium sp. GW3]ANK74472.1 hypothetical protein FA04_18770 [Ensifer adhaerens]KDP70751.1 hypothetical protein FA04_26700 [Ensifer adhaerens]KQX04728.1 hypothetical protein ASD01_12295 [Ensifer sp. Root423]KQX54095.1 hypothetical protein ASD49_03305 [Ensifer sp. Root1298]
MTSGVNRPPLSEDAAEAIAKDIKQGEGHGATSEVPMSFLQSLYRSPLDPARRTHTGFVVLAVIVALLVLFVLI